MKGECQGGGRQRGRLRHAGVWIVVLFWAGLLESCGSGRHTRVEPPASAPPMAHKSEVAAAPPAVEVPSETGRDAAAGLQPFNSEIPPAPPVPLSARPIFVASGIASWYGPPFHNRRGADGKIYNMNQMTAAHRTLPLGSIVRVTNLQTGRSTVVRISDRGPFVVGRILDLSVAAAKAVDVWRPGTAKVRLEVLQTPAPIEEGGRWAVQIGAFGEQEIASQLCDKLSHRYRAAHVLQFLSPTGNWWVRVRVPQDDKKRAEELAHNTQTPQGAIFLVRLD